MMAADFDIQEVIRIEMNKAIEKTIRRNPTARILNLDELRTSDIAQYLQKNRSLDQLEYFVQFPYSDELNKYYEFGRWFRGVLEEIYTIAVNRQSSGT